MNFIKEPILYVDDELENLEGFQFTFMNQFNISTALSAKKALEILDLQKVKVVISDQKMPEMSGIELMKIIKEKHPNIIRIILTAYADIENAIEAINSGEIYRYLSKPWNKTDLNLTIQSALDTYNLREENKNLINNLQKTNEQLVEKIKQLEISENELRQANEEYHSLNEEYQSQNEELSEANLRISVSENLLRNVTDNIPAYVAVVDADTLVYKFVNQKFVDGYKKLREDIIGSHISEIISEKNYEFALPYINKIRAGEQASYINIFELAEGKRYFNVNYVPGFDKNGAVKDILVLTHDITVQKHSEIELLLAKEKAEENDRLKTAFLQNMSHEIRTPMNAIIGFSTLLNNPETDEEKRIKFTSIIINNTTQLLSIVNDILTISSLETHQEKLDFKTVSVNEIIRELYSVFKLQAENQNIDLRINTPLSDELSKIESDKTKIIQIISNLLTNALKFTHKGYVEFGYTQKDNKLEFFVKDCGIGIKDEMFDKIFDRFTQADDTIRQAYGGTGLGLTISKAFVELLGGKIWVESEYGKGATFYFTTSKKSISEQPQNEVITTNKDISTILVAEDLDYNYVFIEEILSHSKYKIIQAHNGKEAIEICKTVPNIVLVLMDIKMPILNGFEAAKQIKDFRPNLPIIAQSAYALEHEIENYKQIFDAYLTKPLNINVLKRIIESFTNK